MHSYNHTKNQGAFAGDNYNSIPYFGDFAGCAWNAQALFAQDATKQSKKEFEARKLMLSHDFGCFSETHGVAGRGDAIKCPQDVRQFWSNGTTTQGGIGLWIKKPFLAKFPNWSWEELVAGRVAVLRLEGTEGQFDIFCVYLDTNSSVNRRNCLQHISNKTRPQNNTHTIITGDFNFVDSMEDRWNLNKGKFSGANNDNSHDARAMHN